MDDIEVEVVSADTGEVVEPTESTESVIGPADTSADTAEPVSEELVELPDGRKLTPTEVAQEYKMLQAEFTRKSQALAEYERGNINNNKPKEGVEEWVPETYDEIAERGAQLALKRLEERSQYEQQVMQQTAERVDAEIEELKKYNPTLNEAQLFQHAMKYGFPNLKSAHASMRDMNKAIKDAIDMTAKNIQTRNADPVSGIPGGGYVDDSEVYDPNARNMTLKDLLKGTK